MTFEQAAISEPLSIGVYAVTLAEIMPGARIGILGSGPIGLSVLLAAREAGATAVYMTDRRDARTRVALSAGATWAGNPDREDVVGAIVSAEQAVTLLKPGGKLMMVGIPEADRISLPIDMARRKEISFQNVRRQNHCLQSALNLIANNRVNVDFMVTHRFPFSETKEAFALVHEYRDGVVKAMVSIHGGNS
jgi:threonine dehydrogenase-like Zn-dependent dehydrogenase